MTQHFTLYTSYITLIHLILFWKILTLCRLDVVFLNYDFAVCWFFFSKSTFSKNSFWNTIRVSNSFDPDQTRRCVGSNLGSNCLHRLWADDTSSQRNQVIVNFNVNRIFSVYWITRIFYVFLVVSWLLWRGGGVSVHHTTVLSAKSNSDVMLCLQLLIKILTWTLHFNFRESI